MAEPARLPNWPRGLSEGLAADYVGLSAQTFRAEVKREIAPQPVWLTARRKVWLREDLDTYLDEKAGRVKVGAADDWLR